jgi:hypothetical protein
MNKLLVKNFLFAVIAFAAVTTLLSSCQRGYGCPYKFEAKADIKK